MASVKKSCEIKGGGQEMAVMVQVDSKISVTTIQVNFVLIPSEAWMTTCAHHLYRYIFSILAVVLNLLDGGNTFFLSLCNCRDIF